MANRINGIDNNRTGPVGPGRAVTPPKDATSQSPGGSANDVATDVEITGSARQLADLERTLSTQSPVDEGRVATIRNDLEKGVYKVNPQHVADQLLQFEQSLDQLER